VCKSSDSTRALTVVKSQDPDEDILTMSFKNEPVLPVDENMADSEGYRVVPHTSLKNSTCEQSAIGIDLSSGTNLIIDVGFMPRSSDLKYRPIIVAYSTEDNSAAVATGTNNGATDSNTINSRHQHHSTLLSLLITRPGRS
jgi:hypothetical protein